MQNDFSINDLTKKHEDDIQSLYGWAVKMTERYGDNEKLANTINHVTRNITTVKETYKTIFLQLLQNDIEVKQAVDVLFRNNQESKYKELMAMFGGWVFSIVMLLLGSVITVLIQNMIK